MLKNKAGFSLLELLVVIAIIGILTSIGALSFTAAQKRARDSVRREHMQEMQDAMEQRYLIENSYIDNVGEMQSSLVSDGYLKAVPEDPKNVSPYTYSYQFDPVADTYCFCARMENAGTGRNSDNSCNTGGVSDDFYCVSNLQ